MAPRFSKCPTWWIRTDEKTGLKKFSAGGGHIGTSIAALKCILAISVSIDFSSRKAKLSISDLEALTGLSRPKVLDGLKRLDELKIIQVDKKSHTHVYELTEGPQDAKWGKVPFERIRKHLREIPNRGVTPLTALKIYLVLVSVRRNDTNAVPIGYDTLVEYTGAQRSHIRSGLDILYSHMLIRITQSDESKERHNVYTISGI
ncbi:UNVERIFIED_ORG: transcription initiation factor IIE alpha subunit [Pseudomonas cremoricolorata]|nr:transcription initiation factor IIE alpha subunit [Pseudomonas cremoricolorata]